VREVMEVAGGEREVVVENMESSGGNGKKEQSALEARSTMRGMVWFPVRPHLLALLSTDCIHSVSATVAKPNRDGKA